MRPQAPPERVDGETFDEMVARLLAITTLETAMDIARLAFGMGGDTPIVDITEAEGDTQGQAAAMW